VTATAGRSLVGRAVGEFDLPVVIEFLLEELAGGEEIEKPIRDLLLRLAAGGMLKGMQTGAASLDLDEIGG